MSGAAQKCKSEKRLVLRMERDKAQLPSSTGGLSLERDQVLALNPSGKSVKGKPV